MKNYILTLGILIFLSSCQSTGTESSTEQESSENKVSAARITEFIHWYPAREQAKMRDQWLSKYQPGEWQFSGKVTSDDRTVVTPQADVNYGYSWFNISNQPLVISMPNYDKYYSLSVFDMNHFMEVYVKPKKPVVIRLPHQKSPIKEAHEIVLQTYQGVALTRQVIVDNAEEVMALANEIKIEGAGGDFPFIIPMFTEEEIKAGMEEIQAYMPRVKGGSQLFGSAYEGVGDMDRAAGVLIGQLGTQARYANYRLYNVDNNGDPLNGTAAYQITVPKEGMFKNKDGYWSLTVYNAEDKYLIANDKEVYNASFYSAMRNADGSVTVRINPEGIGENAIPNAGKNWYCVLRVYEPLENIEFPELMKEE
jgi:hypothetical protein